MTAILVGVGADGDNTRPVPSIDAEGRFEYIPIPETEIDTAESRTYGTYQLRHRNEVAADVVEAIRPGGEGKWITDPSVISAHPLHVDPDFEAMSYGDRKGPGGKGAVLARDISPGDVLGFYTGLVGSEGHRQRYLYGFFTVSSVADLADLDGDEYYDGLRQFPENAHAKRLIGSGSSKHDTVVIVDGEPPGGILEHPIRISERLNSRPWYQLDQEFVDEFKVTNGQIGISRKIPLTLNLDGGEFISIVERYSDWG